jgi:hypothetical protein
MSITLNPKALAAARKLIQHGKAVRDERDAWSEDAPSASQENDYIKKHGYPAYAEWHLGVDTEKSESTKSRFSFPYGDFSAVHRCAVISLESRAAQNQHDEIAKAAKSLLELIDAKAAKK